MGKHKSEVEVMVKWKGDALQKDNLPTKRIRVALTNQGKDELYLSISATNHFNLQL